MNKVSKFMQRKADEYELDVSVHTESYGPKARWKVYTFDTGFLGSFEALLRDEEIIARGWEKMPGSVSSIEGGH
jgi:hypothetical protein